MRNILLLVIFFLVLSACERINPNLSTEASEESKKRLLHSNILRKIVTGCRSNDIVCRLLKR